jgi:hypothetical protein
LIRSRDRARFFFVPSGCGSIEAIELHVFRHGLAAVLNTPTPAILQLQGFLDPPKIRRFDECGSSRLIPEQMQDRPIKVAHSFRNKPDHQELLSLAKPASNNAS